MPSSSPAKVVVITGAGGTLGRAVAECFAATGASLVLLDVNEQGLSRAHGQGSDTKFLLPVDLKSDESVAKAVEATVQRYGRIDALCNIAGGFDMGPAVHETNDALWNSMMEINVRTLLGIVRRVVPVMLKSGQGQIVNVGAGGALTGRPNMGAYCASKAAVVRLTESMSAELKERGIRVNCVLPSIIDTPPNRAAMPDADPKKWVAPSDLAQVIAFLCSDGANAVHGVALPVYGLS